MPITITFDSVNGHPMTKGAGQPAVLTVGSLNSFTLRLTNSGDALPLTAGEPVAKSDAAAKPSSIYLEFAADTFADFKSFDLTPPAGWDRLPFDQPSPMWALAPMKDGSWDKGASLIVTVAKVNVLSGNDQGILPVDVTRVVGLRGAGKSLPVVTQAPGLKDLNDTIDFGFDDGDLVLISSDRANPLLNTLTFHISNSSQSDPIARADWNDPPVFSLSFVTAEADAAGALTTAELADGIKLSDPIVYQDGWKALPRPHGDLTWKMQPLTQEILGIGTGTASTVQFAVTGIETFEPEGLTWAYLTWTKVLGYADGYVARELHKKIATRINSFTVWPEVAAHATTTPVTVKWDVTRPNYINLVNPDIKLDQTLEQGTGAWPDSIEGPTTFNLHVTGASGELPVAHAVVYDLNGFLSSAPRQFRRDRPDGHPLLLSFNPDKSGTYAITESGETRPLTWVVDGDSVTCTVAQQAWVLALAPGPALVVTFPGDAAPTTFALASLPEVRTFFSPKPAINPGEEAVLAWTTFGAVGLRLTYDIDGTTYTRQTPTDIALECSAYTPLPAPVRSTIYTLDVLDAEDTPIPACRALPLSIVIKPEIKSFTVQPDVAAHAVNSSVTLAWEAVNAGRVVVRGYDLDWSEDVLNRLGFRDFWVVMDKGVSTWSASIWGPTTFALYVYGEGETAKDHESGVVPPVLTVVHDMKGFLSAKPRRFEARADDGSSDPAFTIDFNPDGTADLQMDELDIPMQPWTADGDTVAVMEHSVVVVAGPAFVWIVDNGQGFQMNYVP